MATIFNPQLDLRPEWHESFPETRTLPGGWDLSGLSHDGRSPDSGYRTTLAAIDDSLVVPLPEGHPASFPELRTLPRNWDFSGLALGNG